MDERFRCRSFDPAHRFAGGPNNVGWTFAYNPASQIVTETRDNDNYGFAKTAASATYTVNGLNQYATVNGAAFAYDANGNLTDDGPTTYTYDIENRLVKAVAGGTTTNLVYDPLGRLFEVNQGSSATTTRFLNNGDAMVAELNSGNGIVNRFVHGSHSPGDDPLVWYLGSTITIKRWLHADHLGSVVAVTNSSGGSPSVNRYDEYGVPASTNIGRFQYTGQAWLGELGLYYYKARFYSPALGRFMQVDPVGYEDNVNLYAYVGNDPVNAVDPTGLAIEAGCGTRASESPSVQCIGLDLAGLIVTIGAPEPRPTSSQGPLTGETEADRRSAAQINTFLKDERGSFRQTGAGITLTVSRNGNLVQGSVSSGGSSLRFTGRLVPVSGRQVMISGLRFKAPFGARVSSAPRTILIYNSRADGGRIHVRTDQGLKIKDALGFKTFVDEPAGDRRLNE